jgi:hypothetical protein
LASDSSILTIAGRDIKPGERVTIELPVPSLYTHTQLEMPLQIIRGRKPGVGVETGNREFNCDAFTGLDIAPGDGQDR